MKRQISILIIFIGLFFSSCTTHYQKAQYNLQSNNYIIALWEISNIKENDPDYKKGLELKSKIIKYCDSMDRAISKIEIEAKTNIITKNLLSGEMFIDYFYLDTYREDLEAINIIINKFKKINDDCNEAISSNDSILRKNGFTLQNKLKKKQASVWPNLRKMFGKVLGEKAWELNIYVQALGERNSIIEFRSIYFSDNMNIKKIQEQYSKIFRWLKFKKSIYKTYAEDSDYKYYDLYPSKDGEPIE